MSADEIIKLYADILIGIYENRTAGDSTFSGVLSDFLRSINSEGKSK